MDSQAPSILPRGCLLRLERLVILGGLWFSLAIAPALAEHIDRSFLTAQEISWIDAHVDQLRIAPEGNYPPFSFIESDAWRGLSADMARLLEQRIGTRFDILPAQNLDAILASVPLGNAEIVTSLKETPERSQYLSFTQPYVSVPTAIIVKAGLAEGRWPDSFVGKRVAVGKGYGVQKFLEKSFPQVKLTLVPDDLDGIRKLSFGEVDAIIMDVASASFFIEREKITNLRILESFPYTYDLSFGVRKDLPILRDILSKTLVSIPDQDRQAVTEKWIGINQDPLALIWKRLSRWLPLLIGVVATLILIGAMAWRFQRQRRRLEQKVAQYTRSLIEASLDPLVTISVEGKITDVNRATEEVTGAGRDSLINSDFADYFTAPEKAREGYRQAFSQGSVTDYPLVIRHTSGRITDVLYNASVYRDANDQVLGVFAAARDVTERNRAEKELAAYSQRLEERSLQLEHAMRAAEAANVAKSVFLANMSHELRTPMNGVMGMVDLVLTRATDPRQIDWLRKSKSSAKHLLGIINDILDISKIEADRMTLEQIDFSLSQAIEDVMSMHEAAAGVKGLALSREIDATLPDALCGDVMRLKQILINFVGNAIKFSDQGRVTVRARVLEKTNAGVFLRIEVADQGIGISPDQQKRLFHAFTQADDSMTRRYGGTGLGLIIAKRIALLMGGDAGVESEPEMGSTFWFTANLTVGEAPSMVAEAEAISADATIIRQRYFAHRILVVDDEPTNREVAKIHLEAADLVVDAAQDGAEAVAMARTGNYSAILMDMQMPRVNGLTATQLIRQLPGYREVPIVAMTANVSDDDKAQCLAAGMNDVLTKPYMPAELLATLLRALDRHGT